MSPPFSEDPLIYLPRKPVQLFEKGQTIYDCHRPSGHLYVVMLGLVKIISIAEDGCQTIAYIVGTDGLFGESSLLGIQPRNETAITLDKVTLRSWSCDEIEQYITREPRLGLALSRLMIRRCMELKDRIESMAALKTPERVMLALVMLTNDLGVTSADGSVRVRSLSHQTIADLVGTSREIVSGEMNRLRRLGALAYDRRHIDVNPRAMQEQLCQRGVGLRRPYEAYGKSLHYDSSNSF